ncbi:MAG: amidohydrolase, partial [Spirochaetales bacterium]|nr:amidohydrolase [Spirochaetales bacterium]
IPWVREMAVIGNQYPNANLNLIWCHQISPFMTQGMLNEWIDLVPMNKIIGFGGDNVQGPEKTYGVLKMTQENIARALAIRIERGDITESSALDICRAWLYDNPRRIYRLDDR